MSSLSIPEEQKSILYDYLYDIANREMARRNVCEFVDGVCKRERIRGTNNNMACCVGCEHHNKEKGCTVKSLWCKLWICPDLCRENPDLEEFMRALREVAWYAGIAGGCREKK